LSLLFLTSLSLYAQSDSYLQALQKGDNALKKEEFQTAILKYRAAEAFDPSKSQQVASKIEKVFKKILAQKKEAEQLVVEVRNAQKQTAIALEKAQQAEKEAKKQAQIAQINLDKADKLVNAFYFYDGKFALAYGLKNDVNVFYFIDKNGDEAEKLGQWDKAEQFENTDFAKVKKEDEDFLLDTLGNSYRVAYTLKDLKPEIKALELKNTYLDSFPTQILTRNQLEVLILDGGSGQNNFKTLPIEIAKLSNLKVLQLNSSQLDSLPAQIGELKNLQALWLQKNQFSETEKAKIQGWFPKLKIEF